MISGFISGIAKLFGGSKSEKDIKDVMPLVEATNKHFEKYNSLSHDELRAKTQELKQRIAKELASFDEEVAQINETLANAPDMDVEEKEPLFSRLDEIKKERDAALEVILLTILPEAFAVVKETARRFSEHTEIVVTATDYDRDLSVKKDFVRISGDQAIYSNSWTAAGNKVVWNMVHYDVQLIGGIVLHKGKIAEMATGEGKTLVSTLPAYLNALAGLGVHVVTVNDYLARRDCEWNGPIFQFHGLKVDCIDYHQPNSPERRQAYLADITYGTNNEFGFDYLRDNMAHGTDELVQRKHHYAMVDEVDSVLIDDARTPLIISGPVPKGDQQEFQALKPRIEKLVDAQKRFFTNALNDARKLIAEGNEEEGGKWLLKAFRALPKNKALIKLLSEPGMRALLTKTENVYLAENQKRMPEIDTDLFFAIDEKNNSVELKEKGVELISGSGEDPNFFILPDVGSLVAEIDRSDASTDEKRERKENLMRDFAIKSERIHSVNQLLKAYALFERDVEYIIADGKVKIVDEQTGRVMEGRRYSDGLHQAIEAKENVKVEAATQTFATITLQNFFRMYHKLAGMTGTAETEAGEFWQIYKLDVVVIPTNRPITRKDVDDVVYKTKREKYNAVIDEVVALSEAGRPVLVGTTSVEVSELLSKMLNLRKIKHNVLNAKQHQREAEIVAEAGQSGTVTISTNMAGRGTDIKLGPGVKEAGGLAIIGTERHESRRVDRQLRGRAGRQGDPGTSKFFVSLEDNLMRLFGSDRITGVMDRLGMKEGEEITHPIISRSIERAQKKVEQNNFGIRKRLLEYDDVMNAQREVIYAKRRNALYGDRLAIDLNNMLYDFAEEIVLEYKGDNDFEGFKLEVLKSAALDTTMDESRFGSASEQAVTQDLFDELMAFYKHKAEAMAEKAYPVIERIYNEKGRQGGYLSVPVTDGRRQASVGIDLTKAHQSHGRELNRAFEQFIMLAIIDEEWKEHLREMDELKQSVQNAHLEQKDPLLIYKLESFNLFKAMMSRLNREMAGWLTKGGIGGQDQVSEAQAPVRQRQDSRVKAQKQEYTSTSTAQVGAQPEYADPSGGQAPVRQNPIKNEMKVGRNEPCPCGSGKKFKQCHGKDME